MPNIIMSSKIGDGVRPEDFCSLIHEDEIDLVEFKVNLNEVSNLIDAYQPVARQTLTKPSVLVENVEVKFYREHKQDEQNESKLAYQEAYPGYMSVLGFDMTISSLSLEQEKEDYFAGQYPLEAARLKLVNQSYSTDFWSSESWNLAINEAYKNRKNIKDYIQKAIDDFVITKETLDDFSLPFQFLVYSSDETFFSPYSIESNIIEAISYMGMDYLYEKFGHEVLSRSLSQYKSINDKDIPQSFVEYMKEYLESKAQEMDSQVLSGVLGR